MSYHAYLFEIRSIQRFLTSTGKLRDMVAASDLIDLVCRSPLDEALAAVGEDPETVAAPRRAGGAAYLLLSSEDRAKRLRNLWRFWVARHLPGVELVDVLHSGEDLNRVLEEAFEKLRMARNRPQAELPLATPLSQRAPRTGRAAVVWARESREPLDASTQAVRSAKRTDGGVAARFAAGDYQWPDNFEPDADPKRRFPLEKMQPVALLHADGNGMGKLLMCLNERASTLEPAARITLYRRFSEGLEACTQKAAQMATAEVLIPNANELGVLPARPLVLGGDDLTLLIRGDLALDYLKVFAANFERGSEEYLAQLGELADVQLPPRLTIGAGLVWMKPAHPFLIAHQLAEALCSQAKDAGRRVEVEGVSPSTVAFYRMQTASASSLSQLRQQEAVAELSDGPVQLALDAYALSAKADTLPHLDQLLELVEYCDGDALNSNTLREIAGLVHEYPVKARERWQRWRDISKEKAGFDTRLQALTGQVELADGWLPAFRQGERRYSALGDLVTLLAIKHRQGEPRDDAQYTITH